MIDIRDFSINNDRFSEGYDAGREAGYDSGYEDGHAEGLLEAANYPIVVSNSEHFAAGYRAGAADTRRLPEETYQDGWDAGYEIGYQAGIAEPDDE